jgi:hypothetical protein
VAVQRASRISLLAQDDRQERISRRRTVAVEVPEIWVGNDVQFNLSHTFSR